MKPIEHSGRKNIMGKRRDIMKDFKKDFKKEFNRIPLNLQFFADEPQAEPTTEPTVEPGAEPKNFDDILADKTYQSEFDKRVSKALETAKSKWEASKAQEVENAKTEAEKLARMNAEQKAQYEKEKQESDFNKRLADLTTRELKTEARETLTSEGLPLELSEVLNYTDADTCKKSIEAVKTAFQTALEKAVNAKLGSNEPPKRGTASEDAETEKIRKYMGL